LEQSYAMHLILALETISRKFYSEQTSYAQRCYYAEAPVSTPYEQTSSVAGAEGASHLLDQFGVDGSTTFSPIQQYAPTPGSQGYPSGQQEHYSPLPTQYANGGWMPLEKSMSR
jgi:hypothetical protein